ncbi:MAG: hypothetical protein P4M08_03285 [Oligoflexia bacterium]|nr:hypothetical protein [Oligoflexia bacterium]
MKGVFFQKPLELQLLVEGESWRQGDAVSGALVAKNLGAAPASLNDVGVELALGKIKEVRKKSAGAFEPIASARFAPGTVVQPGKEERLSWKFETDRNCAITDTAASPFLVYGHGPLEQQGQLQLRVNPTQVIEDVLGIFEVAFRFVRKSAKSSKGWIEIKLAPPDSKAFAMLEQLNAFFRFESDTLHARYVFNLKKLEATATAGSGIDVKKLKQERAFEYPVHHYRIPSGRFDHERMEASIRELLAPFESKLL